MMIVSRGSGCRPNDRQEPTCPLQTPGGDPDRTQGKRERALVIPRLSPIRAALPRPAAFIESTDLPDSAGGIGRSAIERPIGDFRRAVSCFE
ncbi:hypothetical protein [Nocardia testacea]|uniref:hypothetical protein n=1 Tax=Nocardia testacea TaxID=248551 RepID=UPI003A8BEF50